MSHVAVRVENLGKQYFLGQQAKGYRTLREALSGLARAPFQRLRRLSGRVAGQEHFWALRDVSFEVNCGEVVGVIGRNGAGKSTMLKVLSGITEPTTGRVELDGRVGSLLEVGTGFHAELSGRENIFLNGAILGMTRAEVRRKFDEIVAFAEVEQFIDTPVKHYSSGMYMRLAFGVAAHLEPEILIVDEVLAVGDQAFQKKCLGKMGAVAREGRTVLFVSHNMTAVERLCQSVVILDRGRVVGIGNPRTMIGTYLGANARPSYEASVRTGRPQVLAATVKDLQGGPFPSLVTTEPFAIHLRYALPEESPNLNLGIGFLTADGSHLFTSNVRDDALEIPTRPGEHEARVVIPKDSLLAGEFYVTTCLWNEREIFDLQEPAFSIALDPGPSKLYMSGNSRKGYVQFPCKWSLSCP